MSEYITQEQAVALANTAGFPITECHWGAEIARLCNAAIQLYKDSQPASVEEIMDLVHGMDDTFASAVEIRAAITQQAEALAQALAEVDRLKYEVDAIPAIKEERDVALAEVEKWKSNHKETVKLLGEAMQESTDEHVLNEQLRAEIELIRNTTGHLSAESLLTGYATTQADLQQSDLENNNLRAQLAALQYDVDLPEPVGYLEHTAMGAFLAYGENKKAKQEKLYTADQVRQAIAKAKQVQQGYKLVPETPTNDMTAAMANALEDPENERSSWDLAENMYTAMLAAAPDPKEAL